MTNWNWPELFEEQKQSGKTISEFCEEKGVHYTSFYKNRKKLRKNNFVEIKQKAPAVKKQGAFLTLRYHDFSIDLEAGYDRQSLTDLIKILRAL